MQYAQVNVLPSEREGTFWIEIQAGFSEPLEHFSQVQHVLL
jgi:hypothetical protein